MSRLWIFVMDYRVDNQIVYSILAQNNSRCNTITTFMKFCEKIFMDKLCNDLPKMNTTNPLALMPRGSLKGKALDTFSQMPASNKENHFAR